jgi:hypothetical protein
MGNRNFLIFIFAAVLAAACAKDNSGSRGDFTLYGQPDGSTTTVAASNIVDEGTLICTISASSAQVTAGTNFTMQMHVSGGTPSYKDVYGTFSSSVQTVTAQFPPGTHGQTNVEFIVTDSAGNHGYCRTVFQVL